MAQEWYYEKDGERQGPVTAQELKQLVASGDILPTDQIWKEGMDEWKPASVVTGLFPLKSSSAPMPPPIAQTPPKIPSSSAPENSPPEATKSRLQEFLGTAKQAKELGQAHARKTQLTKSALPKAYLALGKDVQRQKQFTDEFADIFNDWQRNRMTVQVYGNWDVGHSKRTVKMPVRQKSFPKSLLIVLKSKSMKRKLNVSPQKAKESC